ncbi:MAG TPA: MFS transporter [Methylomirabilota bacterium]|nr:MFS transporter [Methylomirabilota bacterium]
MSGTALLCLMAFCNTVVVGAFGPLLPEIGRAQALADWQLGVLAGSFGFARMAADVPTGWLAGRRLGSTLALAPVVLLAGLLLLGSGGPLGVLVLGRILTGLAHTLGMVGGLTAILQDQRGPSASVRLNTFEFSGMLGILGGLAAVGVLPTRWGWNVSLLAASAPLLVTLALVPLFRRRFPDRPRETVEPARSGAGPLVSPGAGARPAPIVALMFAVGAVMALSWSSVSQFLVPLRGEREFGLDRAGISRMLALAQLIDLVALLPVGWCADRVGRIPVLAAVAAVLGLGTWGVGLGSFPLFALGCALFGLGLAGWMLPLGVLREHTPLGGLAWRTGLYRVGVDAAIFLGPLICGFLGEANTRIFSALIGLATLAAAACLVSGSLRRGARRAVLS